MKDARVFIYQGNNMNSKTYYLDGISRFYVLFYMKELANKLLITVPYRSDNKPISLSITQSIRVTTT